MKHYPTVLTIAGSDSSGGAGIQADLKTISALGCYGASAITALTAQNTKGVTGILSVPADFLEKQLNAVFSDLTVDVVKIGMLHSGEIMRTIKKALQNFEIKDVVLDPVMIATSGDKLIEDDTIGVLTQELIPLAFLITPNLDEAMLLLNKKTISKSDMLASARELLRFGSHAVLLKGGHLDDDQIIDVLVDKNGKEWIYESKKIESENVHGTGCTLSSAIASYLALGYPLHEAVEYAHEYVHQAIKKGRKVRVGNGHGPVNHFFKPLKLKAVKTHDEILLP